LNSKTILLIEDDPSDTALTQRALEKARIANRLVIANVCKQAVEQLGLDWLVLNEPPPPNGEGRPHNE
jgi:hypothetical protein